MNLKEDKSFREKKMHQFVMRCDGSTENKVTEQFCRVLGISNIGAKYDFEIRGFKGFSVL